MGLGTESLAEAAEEWEVRGRAIKKVLEAREAFGGNLYSRLFNQCLGQSYQLAKGLTQGLINLCSLTVPKYLYLSRNAVCW